MPPLIPYKSISINTSLTVDEAVHLVSAAIAPPRSFFQGWRKAGKEFEGTVSNSSFTISRAIRYRNSFLPFLYGKFVPSAQGVRVEVRMTMHPLVIAFTVLWFTVIASFLLLSIGGMLTTLKIDEGILLPIGMLLFFYLMVFLGLGFEANEAERFLSNLFGFHRCL
jgi:hypothetical protein